MKKLILLLAVITSCAFGQGVRYDSYNVTSARNVPVGAQANVMTLPYSTVTVCVFDNDLTTPCSSPVNIYSDVALTHVVTQPLQSDSQGRFGFWIAAGTYKYSVNTALGSQVGTFALSLNSPQGPQGPGGIGCGSGNCVVTNPAAAQSTTQLTVGDLSVNNLDANSIMPPVAIPAPVNIIWSDDMDTDPDGAMNQAALLHWVDTGQAKVVAMVADSTNQFAAPTMKIINTYYGYSSIPVGAYQGGSATGGGSFANVVVNQFNPGDTRANYPACATTLRTALAAAASNSITMVTTGFGTCLLALYTSAADGVSSLTGQQLIKAKISRFVIVAGDYPSAGGSGACNAGFPPAYPEYNFCAYDPSDWSTLMTNITAQNGYPPIYFVGYTDGVNGGTAGIPTSFPLSNPVQLGVSVSGFTTRPPWGTLGIYYGIFGNSASAFTISASGTNTVNATTGANVWASSPASGQFYLTNAKSTAFYESLFDGQNNAGADWFMAYNQAGSIIYPQFQCSVAYGCYYGGELNGPKIGGYMLSYGPTRNFVLDQKIPAPSVLEFQLQDAFAFALGVDDGSGSFMPGAAAGDAGIRMPPGGRFYFTDPNGLRKIGFDQAGAIHSYHTDAASPGSVNIDDAAGGRFIATGDNTTTPNTVLIQGISSDGSVVNTALSMNAAGFVQIGAPNVGFDKTGNAKAVGITASSLAGSGKALACLDAAGNLYRGTTTTCP